MSPLGRIDYTEYPHTNSIWIKGSAQRGMVLIPEPKKYSDGVLETGIQPFVHIKHVIADDFGRPISDQTYSCEPFLKSIFAQTAHQLGCVNHVDTYPAQQIKCTNSSPKEFFHAFDKNYLGLSQNRETIHWRCAHPALAQKVKHSFAANIEVYASTMEFTGVIFNYAARWATHYGAPVLLTDIVLILATQYIGLIYGNFPITLLSLTTAIALPTIRHYGPRLFPQNDFINYLQNSAEAIYFSLSFALITTKLIQHTIEQGIAELPDAALNFFFRLATITFAKGAAYNLGETLLRTLHLPEPPAPALGHQHQN